MQFFLVHINEISPSVSILQYCFTAIVFPFNFNIMRLPFFLLLECWKGCALSFKSSVLHKILVVVT